jgi:hypothetical protein
MKAADGEDSPDSWSFARTETEFIFPTSVAACASVNLSCDKPGRKMAVKSRRAPSKMGDILCSLSASANQVSLNLNCFFSVAYLLILFTIKIYHRLSSRL